MDITLSLGLTRPEYRDLQEMARDYAFVRGTRVTTQYRADIEALLARFNVVRPLTIDDRLDSPSMAPARRYPHDRPLVTGDCE
jgi:hypothetical protein